MQARSIDITQQLVADRNAALVATARRGRLHRMFARADRPEPITVGIAAAERADAPTPAVIAATVPAARRAAVPDSGRVHKVA